MFKHVLLPIDLNEEHSWKRALPIATENCRAFDATLHLVTVVPDVGAHAAVAQFFPADYEDRVLDQMRKDLHNFSKANVPEGIKVQHIIAHGTIYKEILDAAKRVKADLIVMAAARPDLEDYLLGPNAARVVRHADCSVMVVRD